MNIKHLLLLFTIPLALFSCSKDKDESSPSIVGKWEYVTETYQYYDAKGVELVDEKEVTDFKDYVKKPYMEFKQDGKMVHADFDADGTEVKPMEFNYTVKGDKLALSQKGSDGKEQINEGSFSIKNDVLTLSGTDVFKDGTKEVATAVLKRVK